MSGATHIGVPLWEAAWSSERNKWYCADRNTGRSSWEKPADCNVELPRDPPPHAVGQFHHNQHCRRICQLLGSPLGITRGSATIFSTESQGSVHGNVRLLLCQPGHTGTFVSGRLCMQLVPRWAAEKDIATSFKHVWAVAEAIGLGNRLDERFHRCFCEECVWARAVHSSIWLLQAGSSYFR